MLHQCLVQWVGEEVKVVAAEGAICIATAETGSNMLIWSRSK
jgi:hypothetical protein